MMTLLLILASGQTHELQLTTTWNTLHSLDRLINTDPGLDGDIVAIEILKVELV